ncbi:MAG TPA: copper resistance CopC family protein [Actinomycetota bacterium]|nr:copper resistance CopC family protein [Actinomycetota bacterium]
MRTLRIALVASFVPALLAAGATAAWGHAAYKDSDPADREKVSSAPSRVTAEFTEPLAEGSYLRVTDPCGSRVDAGDVEIVGYEMSVSMSGSTGGTYVVSYRAFSRLDPHVTQGDFTFTVSEGPACAGATVEQPGQTEPESGSEPPASSETSSEEAVEAASTAGRESSGPVSRREERRSEGSTAGSDRPFRLRGQRAVVPNIQAAAARDEEQESVWDGIPTASFVTGLLLAAIIGAAGGKIYAGIMGPRA